MSEPARRPPKVVLGVSLCVVLLLPAVMIAGAGGMALLTFILACLGLLGLMAHKAWKDALTPPYPYWLLALVVFLSWAWLSQSWSDYPKVSGFSNAEKVWIMGLAFPAVIWLWATFRDHGLADILRKALVGIFGLGVLLLCFESFFGFPISFLVDPLSDTETFARRHADAVRNVGRGLIFASVLTMPIAGLFWERAAYRGAVLGFMILMSLAALKLDVLIAVILPWLSLCVALIGQRAPMATVKIIMRMATILVMAAPVLIGLLVVIPEGMLEHFPASWEHRFLMWRFVCEQIWQHVWVGQGFDSARTFVDKIVLSDGQSVSLLSMHTHNAGLQIWFETGIVGAVLASAIIIILTPCAIEYVAANKEKALGLCGFLTAFILTASLSFGVWQFWWWATLSFGLAVITLTRREV